MADVKLSGLPIVTTMATGDLVPFTSDPGGTPISKNITKGNLLLYAIAAEIITGTEAAKAIPPDQLRASEATAAEIVTGTAVKLITANQAHTSLMKVSGSNLAIGSDADGDMYYRASSVLARLAKGAANLKMFMNAGATAPEWAGGISSTAHTRDIATASGDQTLAGAGFTPSAAIVIFSVDMVSGGIGIKSTTQTCLITFYNSAAAGVVGGTFINVGVTTGNNATAVLAFNSDGGVLTWTKTGTPTGTCNFTVFWIR